VSAIKQAAHEAIPKKKISPFLNTDNKLSDELIHLRKQTSLLNNIYALLHYWLYDLHGSTIKAANIQRKWTLNGDLSRRSCLLNINKQYDDIIDPLSVPFLLNNTARSELIILLKDIATLRNLSKEKRHLLEQQHKSSIIQAYTDQRCTNFATNKAAFIASSLSRTRRSIILDRVMVTNNNTNESQLVTDPAKIKEIANLHFQTIAGAPPVHQIRIEEMTSHWRNIYTPSDDIHESIYENLLIPPTDDEWRSTISNLPNGKATGPSEISYEMLKHMSNAVSNFLKDIVTECFITGSIPSQWKDATIYPIPKPTEWNCNLKNTRPITLLETARKLMTKIMTNRLAKILHQHNILKGNNFAGLPGGSCHTPIHILESVINDAKMSNKPLFIFLQDISKAFDSIDTHMLHHAMNRLKIPSLFTKLVLSLFTNRSNRVITANGLSDPYKVQIGIDQGEVISPLLWVIYIDPLLIALNNSNPTPYRITTEITTSVDNDHARLTEELSTLAFMDDTTLISSSITGLTHMLNVANEFYAMNNTKINFTKADLITNRNPDVPTEPLGPTPAPFSFNLSSNPFSITPIAPKTSFRFLGVWFALSLNPSFVKKQCKTEYRLFTNVLRGKVLTTKQLVYLHNTVLLPKVEYRMNCTIPTEIDCNSIAAPLRILVKRASKFSSSLPSSFLHYENGVELTNLYQRVVQNHIATFTSRFNSSQILTNIYNIRLLLLRDALWTACSPLTIRDFSVWMYTNTFKTDLLFRTIYFASLWNVTFDHLSLPVADVDGSTVHPIHKYFKGNPRLFAKALYQLKKHNIRSFSQCITDNGTALLPHAEIMARQNSSALKRSYRIPAWYSHLKEVTTVSSLSYVLKPEYTIMEVATLPDPSYSIHTMSSPNELLWLAQWHEPSQSTTYGRTTTIDSDQLATVAHWVQVQSPTVKDKT